MPSPVAVGPAYTFSGTSGPNSDYSGSFESGLFTRASGGYSLLSRNYSNNSTSYTLQAYGVDGVLSGKPVPIALGSSLVWNSDVRYDQTILIGTLDYSTTAGFTGAHIGRISPSGSVLPTYDVALPAPSNPSSPIPEFDFAASKTSNAFAVIHGSTTGSVANRVLDIVGGDNALKATVIVDNDISSDAVGDVTALVDGRFLVSWQEIHYTGVASQFGQRPYDRIDLKGRVVDADGRLVTDAITLASVSGNSDGSGNSFYFGGAIEATSDGGFALATSLTTISPGGSTDREVASLWKVGASTLTQAAIVAVTDGAYTMTYNSSTQNYTYSGLMKTSNFVGLSDNRALLTVSTYDYTTKASTATGQIYDLSGKAIDSPFTFPGVVEGNSGSYQIIPLSSNQFIADYESFDFNGVTFVSNDRIQLYNLLGSKDFSGATAPLHVDLGTSGPQDVGGGFGSQSLSGFLDVVGGRYDDLLVGNASANRLSGGPGNDTVSGGAGADILDGGSGDDTAIFDFSLSAATVSVIGAGRATIISGTSSDVISGIEHYQFSDGAVNVGTNPLIQSLFYNKTNLDVFAAHLDAEGHFNSFGWHDGRDPNAFFSTNGYLGANQDVKAAGLNPLQHYDQFGWRDGRDPSASFDTTLYLQHNPDVKAAGIDPLFHFLAFGQAEGRQAYAAIGPASSFNHGSFDAEFYLLSNPDVAKAAPAGANANDYAFGHYQAFGWHEGRNPNAFFDVKGYLNAYADVKAANIDPLGHYDTFGWKDGRDPSGAFDTKAYFAANVDVANAHIDPLLHYLQYGVYEDRSANPDGAFFHV